MSRAAILTTFFIFFSLTSIAQEPLLENVIGKSPNELSGWSLNDIPWGEPDADGSKFAVLEGSANQPGENFTFAFFLPNGEWVKAHWHCADSRTFIAKGILLLGKGDKITEEYPTGSYVIIPHKFGHFEGAKGDMIIIYTGNGPWCTSYTE